MAEYVDEELERRRLDDLLHRATTPGFHLLHEEMDELEALAARYGVDLSGYTKYVRRLGMDGLEEPIPEDDPRYAAIHVPTTEKQRRGGRSYRSSGNPYSILD